MNMTLQRALLEQDRPSAFFEKLRRQGQLLPLYPELEALIGVEQSPVHHPEGDVWAHTMLVVDQAALLQDRAVHPLAFMLAALCHDLGKPATTAVVKGKLHALGHETAGLAPARAFMTRMEVSPSAAGVVLNLIRLHMRPNMMAAMNSRAKSWNRLFYEACCPEDLLLLARADALGRGKEEPYEDTARLLQQQLQRFRRHMAEPRVTEADLREAGIPAGPAAQKALELAVQLHLAEVPRAAALPQVLAAARKALRKGSA